MKPIIPHIEAHNPDYTLLPVELEPVRQRGYIVFAGEKEDVDAYYKDPGEWERMREERWDRVKKEREEMVVRTRELSKWIDDEVWCLFLFAMSVV